ncbi:uncharacterized mitochondrial protein AtMg00240-like [Rutidosis leptorrhynchoides]|uniref:uncharacterized mitochondrial protein AtMg00240-like n=1 Tax=Rutidosis leptorrhynchoides TaxID=125765 RepID=UPI003A9A1CC9
MYLTSSRPDIMFATCLCARYHSNLNVNHMLAAKKIMRHLKGTPSLGLWYPQKDGIELSEYSDSDYGGYKRDFKSTSGGFVPLKKLRDYGLHIYNTPVYVDNAAAITVIKNPVNHSKTKHIGIKYHFITVLLRKEID